MTIKELLKNCNNQIDVDNFINYCNKMVTEKKNGVLKNPYFKRFSAKALAEMYMKVQNEGLVLDGKHITIQLRGLTYDYVAYKNKMLVTYPESIIDINLVYKEDIYSFKKIDGHITYKHEYKNPFQRLEKDIIGGYCIIKNKRGEFITTLTALEFKKHREIAKTDYIWKNWYVEMCMKTLFRKSTKVHFDDIYHDINETDNDNYDLTKSKSEDYLRIEQLMSDCETMEELDKIKTDEAKLFNRIPKLHSLYIQNYKTFEEIDL